MTMVRRLKIGEGGLYRGVRLASLLDSPDAFSTRYENAVARSYQSWIDQADASAAGSDRATFIVVEDRPVGVAALYRDCKNFDVGELIQMWVAPEKRGSSTATDLLRQIFIWAGANGFSRMKAEVMFCNPRALAFYRKSGFTVSAEMATHVDSSSMFTKQIEPIFGV